MRCVRVTLTAVLALFSASAAFAQQTPAIPGHTGRLTTPATVNEEYKGANKIIVAAEDGIEHVFPAGKGPLSDLTPGTEVAVYYRSTVTEGTVTDIRGGKTEIIVRYADGKREKLKLTKTRSFQPGEALKGEPQGGDARVVVYRPNNGGDRVARYFRPKT